jgi:PKD repeat protein
MRLVLPWRARMRGRIAMISAVVGAMAVLVPGVAQAEPPSNDDFGAATVIPGVPYSVRLDTSGASAASDDPVACQGFDLGGTVWFDITPTRSGLLRASTAGSDHGTVLAVYTGDRGSLHLVPGACDVSFSGATAVFAAAAGTTYHLLVTGFHVPGGALSFALDTVPPAANDDFANAEPITALPATRQTDLTTASTQPGEPAPSCLSQPDRSVWYTFTPSRTANLAASTQGFRTSVAIYTGSSLAGLQEVACGAGHDFAVFRATAGVTYYLDVVDDSSTGTRTLLLEEAPPPEPLIEFFPDDPSIFDQVDFTAFPIDPLNRPIAGGRWDFGDGTTAPLGDQDIFHRYTKDGTYQVSLTVSTSDGRTGSDTSQVTVRTHDVSITQLDVPTKARTGQTKPITVQVANTRYPESVTVDLYKVGGSRIGTLTLDVAARPNRTVQFPFAYTFSADDALVGKVTFRAVVSLPFPVRDARPVDNEVIAISTTVLPSLTDLRFA